MSRSISRPRHFIFVNCKFIKIWITYRKGFEWRPNLTRLSDSTETGWFGPVKRTSLWHQHEVFLPLSSCWPFFIARTANSFSTSAVCQHTEQRATLSTTSDCQFDSGRLPNSRPCWRQHRGKSIARHSWFWQCSARALPSPSRLALNINWVAQGSCWHELWCTWWIRSNECRQFRRYSSITLMNCCWVNFYVFNLKDESDC